MTRPILGGELHELLRAAEAPDVLVSWTKGSALDAEQAWAACERADHRIWLAAVSGAPMDLVIEAAAVAVLTVTATFAEVDEAIITALELAVGSSEPEELIRVAEACEHLSAGPTGGYRKALSPGHPLAAEATALVARAAEGLIAGEAVREAAVLERSRALSVLIGAGTSALLPTEDGASRFAPLAAAGDPAQSMMLFVVAACSEATEVCARALALGRPDSEEALDEARRSLDPLVRGALESAA